MTQKEIKKKIREIKNDKLFNEFMIYVKFLFYIKLNHCKFKSTKFDSMPCNLLKALDIEERKQTLFDESLEQALLSFDDLKKEIIENNKKLNHMIEFSNNSYSGEKFLLNATQTNASPFSIYFR